MIGYEAKLRNVYKVAEIKELAKMYRIVIIEKIQYILRKTYQIK